MTKIQNELNKQNEKFKPKKGSRINYQQPKKINGRIEYRQPRKGTN